MKLFTLPANPLFRYFLFAVLFIVASLVLGILAAARYLYTPIPSLTTAVIYEVKTGSSLTRVSRELEQEGYLRHPRLFTLLAQWRGVGNSIKAGEFLLDAGLSPDQLLTALVLGNPIQYRITLLEGWTFEQALQAIWASEKISRKLANSEPTQIARALNLESDNPEGMLFPDTYFYTAGTSDLQLLMRANERLNTVLMSAWNNRLGALPYQSPYEALIVASIIEKESAYGAERGHIAGVFVRRLEAGMRLQSDPTVIYGLGAEYNGNLTRAHLTTATPYNTYRIPALPPTPIALAGRDSIVASLNPLQSDYLYFVAKGNGEHYFSNSLEEHNAAVRRYQLLDSGQ